LSHAHRFPEMFPAEGEECIAWGRCECGLIKYFIDYYGELRKGISIVRLVHRVEQLNEQAVAEFEKTRVPLPPKGNWALMRDYYESNRSRILLEISRYGVPTTARRWRVSRWTLSRIVKHKVTLQ
jgi:hypothetical protein